MSDPIYYALPLLLPALVVAGIILLTLGLRGRPTFSSPRCAKCSYDLRTLPFLSDSPGLCPECGSPLSSPHAVSFGRFQRSPRLLITAAAFLLLPLAIVPLLLIARTRVTSVVVPTGPTGPAAIASMTTPQLLANLPQSITTPWHWQELDRRHAAGTLTKSDIDQAIVSLIARLNAQHAAGRPQEPLHWANNFVESALNNNELSPARASELLQAFYSVQPEFSFRTTVRQGDPIRVNLSANAPWEINQTRLAYSLAGVTADGATPLTPTSAYLSPRPRRGTALPDTRPTTTPETHPDLFSGTRYVTFYFTLPHNLPPGTHELTFTSDLGVLPQSATLRGLDGKPGTPDKWPNPRARWQATTRRSITVVPKDQPLVQLVTDPQSDPFRSCTLRIDQAAVRPSSNGLDFLLTWSTTGSPSIPLAYTVTARAADQTIPLGSITVAPGRPTHGTLTHSGPPSLPPDLRRIDLTLTPDPRVAESSPSITQIWGHPRSFPSTPLSRFDLNPTPTP